MASVAWWTARLPAGGSETWQVDSPPDGIGTRWSARIGDVPYSIDSAVRDNELLPVWTLTHEQHRPDR